MSTGTWYPDPTHRHESRYADSGTWTDYVADAGTVSRDPVPQRPRRRRWPWIAGIGAVVAVGAIALIGLGLVMNNLDRYHADLTKGHGDFTTYDKATAATSYQSDGYHVLIRDKNAWGLAGIEAPTAHTVLGVEIETRALETPTDSAFGPFCWQDPSHGYGFMIDAAGTRRLVQFDTTQTHPLRVLARTGGAPLSSQHNQRLLLTCEISPSLGTGTVTVKGYVDGTKALSAIGELKLSEIRYTGFQGYTIANAPAEWVVSTFWRRGADDIPKS